MKITIFATLMLFWGGISFGADDFVKKDLTEKKKIEMLKILRDKSPKLEKALLKYYKKVKESKDKLDELEVKEKEKVEKIIEKEIEKARKKGDLDALDSLQKTLLDFENDSGNKKVDKSKVIYQKRIDKSSEKHQIIVNSATEKLVIVFGFETKKALKNNNDNYARELNKWLKEIMKNNNYIDKKSEKKWIKLFKSDNPEIWGKNYKGKNEYSKKYSNILPKALYLRFKRLDTNEYVIVSLKTKKYIINLNGTKEHNAVHLGIGVNKSSNIAVTHGTWLSGWGFGHNRKTGDKQYCSWNGQEINGVQLEISINLNSISPLEKEYLLK